MIEKECTCDSECIVNTVDRTRTTTKRTHHWISSPGKCYLVMNNADGHDITKTIDTYKKMMLSKYNMELL